MKLKNVWYGMFQSDIDEFEEDAWRAPHQLDGDVRLDFEDGSSRFITTVQAGLDFRVECGERSAFRVLSQVRDLSDHSLWSGVVGSEVEIEFVDAEHQVLKIEGDSSEVWCCAFEDGAWGGDSLLISARKPSAV